MSTTETPETTVTPSTPDLSDRDTRYRDFIDPETLSSTKALIIGCGAIGAAVARQLAQMGVGTLWLFDDDSVDAVNLGPQGFRACDIGELKVAAVAGDALALNPTCNVSVCGKKFNTEYLHTYFLDLIDANNHTLMEDVVVFLCVDSLEARGAIVEELTRQYDVTIIDARMNAMQARILTVADLPGTALDPDEYAATINTALDSTPEPCTGRSSNWTAVVAAGFMVSQMVKVRACQPIHGDFTISMSSCMITKPSDG